MPPWEWRHKGKQNGKKKAAIGQTGFHGNIKSHVFHQPGCKHFNCKNCIEEFSTAGQAVMAGYRPCGMCKP